MRGIDSEGLDSVRQKILELSSTIEDETDGISKQFLKMSDTFNGTDLLFLTDKIREEINQFERIKQNNDKYTFILLEVIKSYQSQNDTIREVLNNVTPR